MSLNRSDIEKEPGSFCGNKGPDFDFEVSAAAVGVGRVTVRTLCDEGRWFPKSPLDLYEALMDAEAVVVGGGKPTNEMLELAMELLYRDAWWLDLQRFTELYDKCDVSRFLAEPSDVYEVEFEFGGDEAQQLMVYNMTQFPLSKYGFESLRYLMNKILTNADLEMLTELDRIIIAGSNPDDAFFYYCPEWVVISAGLFEAERTIGFEGRSYTHTGFLDRIAQSLVRTGDEQVKPKLAKISKFEGYQIASPVPVWVQYDPSFSIDQAS